MARDTRSDKPPQAHPQQGGRETRELRQRIERLEERLSETLPGDDGLAVPRNPPLDQGIDKSGSHDPLQRAVRRSNIKRGSRKV